MKYITTTTVQCAFLLFAFTLQSEIKWSPWCKPLPSLAPNVCCSCLDVTMSVQSWISVADIFPLMHPHKDEPN
jgi:hypothetical protein